MHTEDGDGSLLLSASKSENECSRASSYSPFTWCGNGQAIVWMILYEKKICLVRWVARWRSVWCCNLRAPGSMVSILSSGYYPWDVSLLNRTSTWSGGAKLLRDVKACAYGAQRRTSISFRLFSCPKASVLGWAPDPPWPWLRESLFFPVMKVCFFHFWSHYSL